jgi:hypothetical protein
MKKYLSIIIVFCMLFNLNVAVISAEDVEHVRNGSFETLKDDGSPQSWNFSGGNFGEDFTLIKNDVNDGNNALRIKTSASSVFTSQSITSLVENTKYNVTVWAKVLEQNGKGIAAKLEFRGKDGSMPEAHFQKDYPELTKGSWQKVSFDFTAPKGVTGATLLLRLYGGGEVLYDNISIKGDGKVASEVKKDATKQDTTKTDIDTSATVPTDGVEYVRNGSFEALKDDGSPSNWSFSGGKFGEDFTQIKGDVKDGENALKIKTSAKSVHTTQGVPLKGGEKYVLSFWVKVVEQSGNGAAVKFEFITKDAAGKSVNMGAAAAFQEDYKDIEKNTWQQKVISFTAPEGATNASLLLRYYGGGEVYYDGVSILGEGETSSKPAESDVDIKNPVDNVGSLVINGDFEKVREDGRAEGWNDIFGNDTKVVSISTEDAHSGKNSIRINNNNKNQPWARQTITEGITEDAVYQTTAWVKTSSPAESIKFKWEFRRRNDRQGDDYFITGIHSEQLNINPGVWTKVVASIRLPKETKVVDLYIRLFGEGDVYWDDVEFYMVEEPPKTYPNSDTYYYTEWGTGKASIAINDYYKVDPANTVDFILKDGEKVLSEQLNTKLTDNQAFFEFGIMQLAEIGKAYHVDMIYKDGAGNIIDTGTEEVYRYNRPTRLNEDGLAIVNGEVFTPVIGYHVPIELLPRLKEAGINTVQSYHYRNSEGRVANSTDIDYLIKYLDEAHKYDIMVLPVLYPDMLAAGHPANIEKTQAAVAAVKDHPAVLGYMVLDEPYNHVGSIPPGSTYEDMDEWLKASYKVIRDVDPHNVVYACSTGHRQEQAVKFLDAFTRDPYPPVSRQMSIHVSNSITQAVGVANYRKPIWVINTATAVMGGYVPNSNAVRHMAYQSLFAGAKALGWYQVQAAKPGSVNLPFEIWDREGISEGIECFAQIEQEDAIKHFITGEYPLFSGSQNEDSKYWYRVFVKDNELYAVILSRSTGEAAVEIPLTSYDGSISVGAFKAVVDDISGQPDISGNGTLSFTLNPEQVVRFKITPNEGIDFSSLKSGVFRDLVNYPWAIKQIEAIAEKGIVNSKGTQHFVPQENITRADFAYFLIRTLGLTSDSTETFGDVLDDAHYAKEIATGKALGILKGVGDDSYNPNAAISRQDMMTICARGMEYAGKLGAERKNESVLNFTDANMISDYAIDSITAMVSEGIVLGNADGTINPIGNTIRAEAAVIMYRILNK